MMNREQLQLFQSRFEEEMKRISYKGAIQKTDYVIPSEEKMDETDLTALELDQSVKMRLHKRESLFLHKIEAALARIASGSFGECEECGDDIGFRRLEVRPTATRCVRCKEEEEKTEVHYQARVLKLA